MLSEDCSENNAMFMNSEDFVAESLSVVKKLRVVNQQGLHARPAVFIVRLLQGCDSTVTFTYRKQTVDAHSVLGLLMLAAPKNAWITVSVSGSDAADTVEKLEEAFCGRFGEQCSGS